MTTGAPMTGCGVSQEIPAYNESVFPPVFCRVPPCSAGSVGVCWSLSGSLFQTRMSCVRVICPCVMCPVSFVRLPAWRSAKTETQWLLLDFRTRRLVG